MRGRVVTGTNRSPERGVAVKGRRESSAACAAALVALGVLAWGASGVTAAPADVADGRSIVLGETVGRELTCARCHGERGTGDATEGIPRLAAQSRFYLRKQLEDFASGARPSETMAPIARALTPDRWEDVAAYFESLEDAPYPPQSPADPVALQRGGVLSAIGDLERNVRACEVCHADAGVGFPPSFPYLAGQHAGYTERQLLLWKRGIRDNDPLDVMGEIARVLSEEEIRALAVYFARLRPPLDSINRPIPVEPAAEPSALEAPVRRGPS